MLNTYVTEHNAEQDVVVSTYYCTTIVPAGMPFHEANLVTAVAGKTPDPIVRSWGFTLQYPSVSQNPAEGVAQTTASYQQCARCHLSSRRTRVVFHRGDPASPVVYIGEGPGQTEDENGIPFCGPAGRLQDRLNEGAGIDSGTVGWMNLVGCRPCNTRFSADRPPTLVEKAACSERTLMLLRALRPSVVVCLGVEACGLFWDDAPPPWTWHTLPGGLVVGHARHPSYLLRRIMTKGGDMERVAGLRFYGALKERMPYLKKLPTWPVSLHYLGDVAGRVIVGT